LVGYKEWGIVCETLGAGRQHVLLRKGGIHEGRAGFSFKHERFHLFPTRFHAQAEQVRIESARPVGAGEWEAGDEIPIRYRCEAVWATTLTDWETVRRLEPYHVWTEDLVRERFDCGEVKQIHCALVRVFALPQPWVISYEKKHGGCRTWVDLPERSITDEDSGWPVIPDEKFAAIRNEIESLGC
jgi:hypothetical protein